MIFTPAEGINLVDYPTSILEGKHWRISKKCDGVRRYFEKTDKDIRCYSRTNKYDKWLGHICEMLEAPWFPSNRIYDCELVDHELYFANVDSFILRAETTAKASQQFPDNKKDLMALCFDIVKPEGDIRTGWDRNKELIDLFSNGLISDPIQMVPIFSIIEGADMDTINHYMDKEVQIHGEGLMLMNMDAPYIYGRSNNLVKVKKKKDFIGKVIDVEMAKPGTKIEGGIAALICTVPGCTVPVRIGSGFNMNQRLKIAHDSNIIGKLIEIEAFSYTRNKHGNVSLNFAIFKRVIK